MKHLKRVLVETEDGSSSLFIPNLNEHYHSKHGAIQESMHVFINAGLKSLGSNETLKIFEMGFGTGLNCILTYLHAADTTVEYHTLEKYPIEIDLINLLNYKDQLKLNDSGRLFFDLIHNCLWNRKINISASFSLLKMQTDIKDYQPGTDFNLIYFDAFAPEIQPDLWSVEIFEKMYLCLANKGVLTTYCSKGQVRRNLLSCGFEVERLPGPPGKREILRATKRTY